MEILKLNTLQGNLQLQPGETSGTVALLNAKNEIISVTQVNDDGWYLFSDATDAAVKIIGIPGAVLSEEEMEAEVVTPRQYIIKPLYQHLQENLYT